MSNKTNLNNLDIKEGNVKLDLELNDITSGNELISIINDFDYSLLTRIEALKKYAKIENNISNILEVIFNFSKIYYLSGSKNIESFLQQICTSVDNNSIPLLIKLESIRILYEYNEELELITDTDSESLKDIIKKNNQDIIERNKNRKKLCFEVLDKVCQNYEELPTTSKIDALMMLINSIDYKEQVNTYLLSLINNQNIDCSYRYKFIIGLIKKQFNSEVNINFYIKECISTFFSNELNFKNNFMYKILSAQFILINKDKLEFTSKEIGIICDTLYNMCVDLSIEENNRADIADTLLRLGTSEIKEKSRAIITKLGKSSNIFNNSQNVHNDEIEKSTILILEDLIQNVPININTTIDTIINEINSLINHYHDDNYNISEIDKEKIKLSLNRITMDQILYSKYNMNISKILILVWTYINTNEFSNDIQSELRKRMIEELIDMSGMCSSGYIARLINVISGYTKYNITISWQDQIISNVNGRLNASIKNIINEKDSLYYMDQRKLNEITLIYLKEKLRTDVDFNNYKPEEIKQKLDVNKYFEEDKDDKIKKVVEQFQSKVLEEMMLSSSDYGNRIHFLKFSTDYIPNLRENLYQEFNKYISDDDFELYFRKAIMVYEGN